MNLELKNFLEYKAYEMRLNSIIMTSMAGSGHVSSCLSAADLVAALFFYAMKYDPQNPENPNNDRFVLSKGHAAPLLYAAWKEAGLLTQEDLFGYRQINSVLEGHPTSRFSRVQAATGSLGIGLSIGLGMALSARLAQRSAYTYVLLGDAEIAEGSIWEAAEIASYYQCNSLIAILDDNRLGQSAESLHGHHTQRYASKFEAFGWHTIIIDGHDMQQIIGAFDKAKTIADKPTIIIAKTLKGYGIDAIENKEGWHGKPIKKEELSEVLEKFEARFSFIDFKTSYQWKPTVPAFEQKKISQCTIKAEPHYILNDQIATRKAYGQAITTFGSTCQEMVSLDAEVKNSTYAEIFEEKFPDRFFQCFVAEQNMVSMGVGFDCSGYKPFISTFGAFFTRAFDQIRMAAIGRSSIKLVGSHAGVSIGQDGPSQMALEDIAMMRAVPGSIILYPADAVSTHALVACMVNYNDGISYLRTTRMETPVMYSNDEKFEIGGCKVLYQSEQDIVCVIAAGITLFEAIKAYQMLQQENISISIIDLYSIKPLDKKTIIEQAKKAGNRIITVEDHYLEGGLGQAVTCAVANEGIRVDCLAVTQLPRSGKPEELLALMQIDAAAIIKKVKTT